MDSLHNWIVWIHILGGFTFALAHGVSAGVAFKLREEREVPRVQALPDLSRLATNGMYVGIFVLLGGHRRRIHGWPAGPRLDLDRARDPGGDVRVHVRARFGLLR